MENSKNYEPKGEAKIREEVIQEFEEMGYDPNLEENKPIVEKMVDKELKLENERVESTKKLSKAIEQKRQWREKATQVLSEDDEDGEPKPKGDENTQKPQEIDTSNFVTKEELHRQKYPNLTDDEYTSINALAKSSGKSFEETMETNPIAKSYLETAKINERVANATQAPSTRASAGQVETEGDKIANELDRDLPPGFSSKK
jgi:hypothetical protein